MSRLEKNSIHALCVHCFSCQMICWQKKTEASCLILKNVMSTRKDDDDDENLWGLGEKYIKDMSHMKST